MADKEQLRILRQGVQAWNEWRGQPRRDTRIDLRGADLSEADLIGADLQGVDLQGADLIGANLRTASLNWANLSGTYLREAGLRGADLREAVLPGADLFKADLRGANLHEANLIEADLSRANLTEAKLCRADLSSANLVGADLRGANFSGANLSGANLQTANLGGADLSRTYLCEANLISADLSGATLTESDLSGADLTHCRIYGVSAWRLRLSASTKQQGLIITRVSEPEITTDDIEVAQFLYLLIHNEKLRKVIDTITSKVVLILGRFSDERKAVLDAVRDALRKRDLLPVIFDFAIPASRNVVETVKVLAGLASFVIADITDATEVRAELQGIVPLFPSLAVQPILLRGQTESVSVEYLRRFHWFLPPFEYDTTEHLLTNLDGRVVAPAEAKVRELQGPQPPAPSAA
jgi:uncharacterized protein YjbI with pentapeptide repeats